MSKRNKGPQAKPHYMTARCPENRRGTRTYRAYMLHMTKGNGAFTRAEVLCTRRQARTAMRAFDDRKLNATHQGRVIRAILRMLCEELGREIDRSYFGHP